MQVKSGFAFFVTSPVNPTSRYCFSGRSKPKVWSELCFIKLLVINDLLKLDSLLGSMHTWSKASDIFLNN